MTGYEVGKLARKAYLRGLTNVQEGYLVEQIGEPLAFFFPVEVQSPEGIVQRFGTHIHLCGECLLCQVLQGSA